MITWISLGWLENRRRFVIDSKRDSDVSILLKLWLEGVLERDGSTGARGGLI